MIDVDREKFWSKSPTLEYRGNGTVIVKCGDCGWHNDIPNEPFVRAKDKAEAMTMLGTHYLITSRHEEIDAAALATVTLAE